MSGLAKMPKLKRSTFETAHNYVYETPCSLAFILRRNESNFEIEAKTYRYVGQAVKAEHGERQLDPMMG